MGVSSEKAIVLKFLSDFEDITKGIQATLDKFKGLVVPIEFVPTVGGKPISGADDILRKFGGSSNTATGQPLVKGSPGQTVARDMFGRAVETIPHIQSDPAPRTEFDRLRQDNSSFHYLEAQRATNARMNAINMMTGGKSESEFLSDRIAKLTAANDPKQQGAIAALGGLKDTIDQLNATIAALTEIEKKAISPQDRADAAVKIEDAVRAKQQVVQTANNFGGGGKPDPDSLAQHMARYWTREKVADFAKESLASMLLARQESQHTRASIGDTAANDLQAVTRISMTDLLTTLNPMMRAAAEQSAGVAANKAITDKVVDTIKLYGEMKQAFSVDTGALPVGGPSGAGAALVGTGVVGAGAVLREAAWNLPTRRRHDYRNEYLKYGARSEAAHAMALEAAEQNYKVREAYMASNGLYGTSLARAIGAESGAFTMGTGFNEEERMGIVGAGASLDLFGSDRSTPMALRAGKLARATGRGLNDVAGQMAGLAGLATIDGQVEAKLLEIYSKAMEDGLNTSALGKLGTEALVSMASAVGGAAGPSGIASQQMIQSNALRLFGGPEGSSVGAINMAKSFASKMNDDMTGSGIQEYLQMGAAGMALSSVGVRDEALQAYIGSMNASELSDPMVRQKLRSKGLSDDQIDSIQSEMFKRYGADRLAMLGATGDADIVQQLQNKKAGASSNLAYVDQLQEFAAGRTSGTDGSSGEFMLNQRTTGALGQAFRRFEIARSERKRSLGDDTSALDEYGDASGVINKDSKALMDTILKSFTDANGKLGPAIDTLKGQFDALAEEAMNAVDGLKQLSSMLPKSGPRAPVAVKRQGKVTNVNPNPGAWPFSGGG